MKRIVKETLSDGRIRFRVETNRILGFIPIPWTTDLIYDGSIDGYFEASFSSLTEAKQYCGMFDKVINREIL